MKKILSFTFFIVVFVCVLFFATGYAVGGYYSGEYNFALEENKSEVWDILVNYGEYFKARDDIESIETTGQYGSLYAWKENLTNGGYRKYRQLEKDEENKIVIELIESSYGMSGKWEFSLEEKEKHTFIKIKETSNMSSVFMAGYMYYFTRNTETLAWVKLIKLRILGRLISSS